MKRIEIIQNQLNRLLAMSWALGAGALMIGLGTGPTSAEPLNPNDFLSLGPTPFTSNGTYIIDTSGATPTLYDPNTNSVATGVVSNGIAIFTFDDISIGALVNVLGLQNAGSRPVALLSQGDITIDGTLNVSGANGSGASGVNGGAGGAAGPGGGGGGGGGGSGFGVNGTPGSGGVGFVNGDAGMAGGPSTHGPGGDGGAVSAGGAGLGGSPQNEGGGGAFGGDGGDGLSAAPPNFGLGGTAYGNLATALQGGSGGGGAGAVASGGPGGGGGGGAVEIGAISNIVIAGTVSANGGVGPTRPTGSGGGGGGGGGGIIVHGDAVSFAGSGALSAAGGAGPGIFGLCSGGGGGGRVHVVAETTITSADTNLDSRVNVSGGTSCFDAGEDGELTTSGAICQPVYTVVNTADGGPGSLREAIEFANACTDANIIEFDPSAYGTIRLTSGELLITGDLFIDGPGATNVAVNGNYPNTTNRVFHIGPGLVATIAGLTITNGRASGSFPDDSGGGIINDHATLTVSNCTISGNSASAAGGVYNYGLFGSATLTILDSTLNGNSADLGGGIVNDGNAGNAILMVIGSTFSGNSVPTGQGGGIFTSASGSGSATLTVLNSTFSGNSAGKGNGGGIANADSGAGVATVMIGSTILNASTFVNGGGTVTSLGYNLSSDGGGGVLTNTTDLVNTNALLGPLQLNGGQTPTHALLCGGPAIDAGTNFTASATDQRGDGFPRTFGAATDIGAFELQTLDSTPPSITCPSNQSVSATSSTGATVAYPAATATDNCSVSVVSAPASGSLFPIGDTTVTSTATDSASNMATCTFTVHVQGTEEQLTNLGDLVVSFALDSKVEKVLRKRVDSADKWISKGKTKWACRRLEAFIKIVGHKLSKGELTQNQANQLIASATNIHAVLGCE